MRSFKQCCFSCLSKRVGFIDKRKKEINKKERKQHKKEEMKKERMPRLGTWYIQPIY